MKFFSSHPQGHNRYVTISPRVGVGVKVFLVLESELEFH